MPRTSSPPAERHGTDMFVRVLTPPHLNQMAVELRVSVWHAQADADAGQPPFFTDVFRFSRDAATRQVKILDPADGWPLLDDDSRAPAYTLTEARQKVRAEIALFGLLKTLADAVVDPTAMAQAQAQGLAIVDGVAQPLVGRPYVPAGRAWKLAPRPTLTVQEIKACIRRRYDREVVMRAAAEALASQQNIETEFSG